jgi:acyl-CoA hydrolase/GNAT superfamily N-acetyltransferase
MRWEKLIVSPDMVMEKVKPGMSIFIGTGPAEPRTLVKRLMTTDSKAGQDLELIQLVSLGDAITLKELDVQRYRLKTFCTGWVADKAITSGRIDLIPSRFSWIPELIESEQIPIDAAFIQITPPDRMGNCSLGIAVDVVRLAMEKASLVVGEINHQIPYTYGDTIIHVSDFSLLVQSTERPILFERWPVDDIFKTIAANIEPLIKDGSCLSFSIGSLFEALGPLLVGKKDLGIHSPLFTDALMELILSGAVTNRRKEIFRGKSLTSYILGTPELLKWLDRNPMVELQGIDRVFNPSKIGLNPQFVAVIPVRKVDLTGRIALHVGKGAIATGPAEVLDLIHGAEISPGGFVIFALPSRNRQGKPNILGSIKSFQNQFGQRESVDMVVTEFGVAYLKGHTLRERALALIEIAHPDDRLNLLEKAKRMHILYPDQIIEIDHAHPYPGEITTEQIVKEGLKIRFRPIKSSDEEGMRRFFYQFSDISIYSRYFAHIRTMPHAKMQEYVNVNSRQVVSIVGLVGEPGRDRIVAESRYIKNPYNNFAELVFFVDEQFQGLGIASYLYKMLIRIGKDRGLQGFTASVLSSNIGMLKVFKKGALPIQMTSESGVCELTIPFY